MALDESTENLERLESNGVILYMDPRLKDHLARFGQIKIDHVNNPGGQSGYTIQIGDGMCGSGGCDGCASG